MIGILVPNSISDEDFNKITKNRDYCVFGSLPVPKGLDLPYLQMLRVYDFKGDVICSNIETAQVLIDLPLPNKKYFYVRSFEWESFQSVNYNDLKKIYLNDDIELIASSKHVYNGLKKLFKEPKAICKNWNFSSLEK